jgi:hypothetical protein
MVGGRKTCNKKKGCFIYHEEIDGRIKSWAARWMYVRWMDGWMDGWWDEWMYVCADIAFVVTTVFSRSDAGIR